MPVLRSIALATLLTSLGCGGADAHSNGTLEATEGESSGPPYDLPRQEATAAEIRAIEGIPMPDFEEKVRAILLRDYDDDRSGWLDSEPEMGRIDCEVWRAIDEGHRRRTSEEGSIRAAYGFAPGTFFEDSLGVHRNQREWMRQHLPNCGLR